ncbi:MAG: thioredoxin family protein [Polyangiaceae bacterium]|jgi:thiol-disulfide isomerase/thioredoxin
MLPLGTPLPPIVLTNAVDGTLVDVGERSKGTKGTLVAVICNHCPFVVHIRQELVRVAHEAIDHGLAVAAINSNDAKAYVQDGPDAMARLARAEGWRFPFLFDETQDVARSLGAACTPDLFLFDAQQKLAYRGQFDDSRPSNRKPVTGADLRRAIGALLDGRAPSADQHPSVGCNIKWRRT